MKKAINQHANYNTAELDRSRPVHKGAATRSRLGEQVAIDTQSNGHKLGRKGSRRAAESTGADWRGGGRHGGVEGSGK